MVSNVTLLSVSSVNVRRTLAALRVSMKDLDFGAVKLITHARPKMVPSGIEVVHIEPISNINQYNWFMLYSLHEYVETKHCLVVQADGFVINPKGWQAKFLEYDYIGAPWPISHKSYVDPFGVHQQVGNGGFSLRSKRLLSVPERRDIPWDVNSGNFYNHMNANLFSEDGNICVHNRHLFELEGCKFAPVDIAAQFSQENWIPAGKSTPPFGFHKRDPGTGRKRRAPLVNGWL